MPATKFLARDITLEILITAPSTYSAIGGIESLTHSPSTERADTADFDSNGRAEHFVTQRGDEWAIAGYTLEDVDTGDRDPGQAAVEALAQGLGPIDSIGKFRMTSPGGNIAIFNASCEVTLAGGAHNDLAAWGVTITVTGDVTYTPAP